MANYNIPSNNRELQLDKDAQKNMKYYNIPSNNRELQPGRITPRSEDIITYQVITGNYSSAYKDATGTLIITYQVITGNYSKLSDIKELVEIITYQVITGNYSGS